MLSWHYKCNKNSWIPCPGRRRLFFIVPKNSFSAKPKAENCWKNWTIEQFQIISLILFRKCQWQIQYNFFLHQRINWNGTNDLKNVCKIEINKNICAAHSVEHQIAIIAQQVVCRDTATGSRSYDGSTISTFEVCLYRFIITSIAQNHAPQF